MTIELEPIGVARTPYTDWAPNQPPEREAKEVGAFRIVLDERYSEGLFELDRFSHVIIIAYLERAERAPSLRVKPPWAKGREVGLWASRSPNRPNPIGLSVVRLLRVEENELLVSPIDLFDGTPILDVKPYIVTLDARTEANDGWIEGLEGHRHLLQHVRGVPHEHEHEHEHEHGHEHGHEHEYEHEHEHGHEHGHGHGHS